MSWSINPDYRQSLAGDGGLGDSEVFQDVVPEADRAGSVLFVDFDAGDWLTGLARATRRLQDNLEPLAALGISALARRRDHPRQAAADDRLSRSQARPTRSTIAPVIATRSAGAISRSRPRRPPETRTVAWSSAEASTHGRVRPLLPDRRDAARDVPGRPLGRGHLGHHRPAAAERAGQRLEVEPARDRHDRHDQPAVQGASSVLNTRAGSTPSAAAASSPYDAARGSWS